MKRPLIVSAISGYALCFCLQASASTPLNTNGALFGIRETVEDIDLSPDGNRVAYVTPGPGRSSLVLVADMAGGTPMTIMQSDGHPEHIDWCKFASNTRLICQFTGVSTTNGVLVPFSRLIAVDADGKNAKPLGQSRSSYDASIRQFDGDILDWLPDENGAVLMSRVYVPEEGKMNTRLVRTEHGLGVDHIDLATMKSTKLEAPAEAVDSYMSDGRGNVRIKSFQAQHGIHGDLAAIVTYNYRLTDSKDWLPFSTWDGNIGMEPIAIDADSNSAYVLKPLNGRRALYRVKLDGSLAAELVYKNDKVDVDGVVRVRHGSRVIGVSFAEERSSVIYFDPEYGNLADALGKALPNLPLINFAGASADNNQLLIIASSDSDPGRYYRFDKVKHTLNEILLARPTLEQTKLASVKPITYTASDGTAIPAYLTLPPGMESAKGLPAIVLPHGGPSSRDVWGFDWIAQFLAHEGYAVLQPNYRGSAGFGDSWLQENGFKSWKTSIGDVTAAGRWLIAQGIADPKRLAIVGWSYGGYAALQSGVTDPDLFKAIVAIAPVTDLDLFKREWLKYTNSSLVSNEIGSGPHVVEGSPLQNVARIAVPVLLFHGDQDLNVNVEQSQKMDAKLREAGKSSELVVYAGLEHSLPDSNVRAQMLDKIAAFLKANIEAK
jgi:dipeptidyl aminopeptidase/acylaminoacyl peptidase